MVLYKNTVSTLLWDSLKKLMNRDELNAFRLVGGTALSLQLGHRLSVDIDLFTDAEYGSINFSEIELVLNDEFSVVQTGFDGQFAFGKSYLLGNSSDDLIKLDLYYTDKFIFPIVQSEEIRLASLSEITAMKIEVVGNNGRKKDFWDLNELLFRFSMETMLELYAKRYPYGHSRTHILQKMIDFEFADDDFDPICLKHNYWELIKLDIKDAIKLVN